jgi:hypothetical protein
MDTQYSNYSSDYDSDNPALEDTIVYRKGVSDVALLCYDNFDRRTSTQLVERHPLLFTSQELP